jgi:membrane fusion protein (multidrug efflux system)
MIVITVTCKGSDPKTYKLDSDRIRIGRESDNDVILAGKTCSRYHAEIVRSKGDYKIIDLGSTNGIKIGSERVQEMLITHGISIGVGQYTLSFVLSDQQADRTVRIAVDDVVPETVKTEIEPPEAPAEPAVLYIRYLVNNQLKVLKIVAGAEYLIGRSPSSDLVLDDRNVSARHARISTTDDGFSIQDLGSSNGTQVNGKPVRESALEPGDSITIGSTKLTVQKEREQQTDEDQLLARTQLRIPPLPEAQSERLQASGSRTGIYAFFGAMVVLAAIVGLIVLSRGIGQTDVEPGPGTEQVATGTEAGAGEVIVQVAAVAVKELVIGVSGAGSVKPQQSVTVSAEVAARVVDMPATEGAAVSRGQLLVRLDDRDLRLKIDEAKSAVTQDQVELARQDYQRKERLFNDGAITRSVYDQSKGNFLKLEAAYRSNQARIRQLQEAVAKTRISAPASGTVARTAVSQGEVVAPGMPVVVIESMDEVMIELEVSDREIVKVRPLQTVEATTDAFPGRVFPGAVERVGSTANPVTKGFKVEARIGNQEGHLRSGMIASVTIILEKRSGLVIPTEALLDRHGDSADVLVVSNATARRVTVSLGQQMDREVELVRGLEEGDEVIVYGHESVKEGQAIKVYRD